MGNSRALMSSAKISIILGFAVFDSAELPVFCWDRCKLVEVQSRATARIARIPTCVDVVLILSFHL